MATKVVLTDDYAVEHVDGLCVQVKKCCASCAHKRYHNEETRLCMRGHGIVKPSHRCHDYSLEPLFKDGAHIGQGVIKRKSYLNFFNDMYAITQVEVLRDTGSPDYNEALRRIRESFEKRFQIKYYHDL